MLPKTGKTGNQMTGEGKQNYTFGERAELLRDDGDVTSWRILDDTGFAKISIYHVFPGIDLMYHDIRTSSITIAEKSGEDLLRFDHCLEGRMEEYADSASGGLFYLTQGDLSIRKVRGGKHVSAFPMHFYRGITVFVELDKAPKCIDCFMEDVDVEPAALARKFCSEPGGYVMRADASVVHILSELYSVPETIRKGYLKLKILELFLFLSAAEMRPEQAEKQSLRKNGSLADRARDYVLAQMEKRVTIEELSDVFHVSPTQIKNSFRSAYGMPVYAYIRTQKMHAAAELLRSGDATILEVAGRFGYDNGSKFAKAFRDVMGVTPKHYRKMSGN